MKKILASFLLLLLFAPLSLAQSKRVSAPKTLAFTHVTVIDTNGAGARPDMTVIVARGRIVRMGKSKQIRLPQGAQITHLDDVGHIPMFEAPQRVADLIVGFTDRYATPPPHEAIG